MPSPTILAVQMALHLALAPPAPATAPTTATTTTTTTTTSEIAWAPCALTIPAGMRIDARCGSLDVPVGADDPAATLTLGFSHLRATGAKPSSTPMVLLSGGPGQSATRDFVALKAALEVLQQDRDLYFFDIRGTGRSTPTTCEEPSLKDGLQASEADNDEALKRCFAALPFPARTITTTQAVADLERTRVTLGVNRWHVLGISYGTRLAVAYGQAHPTSTASLVLDGVVPLDGPLGPAIATDMTSSLQALGDETVANFVALKARLAEEPAKGVVLHHPRTGAPTPVDFTAKVINSAVRMALYADETRVLIPSALVAALKGDFTTLGGLALLSEEQLGDAIHTPVNISIICAEDVPRLGAASTPPPQKGGPVFDDEVESLKKACASWPVPQAPLIGALPTAIPTLAISGAFDPVTPPRHFLRSASSFSRHRHLVAGGQGHNVLPRGCMAGVVRDILTAVDDDARQPQPSTAMPGADVDVDCLERLGPFPVFLDNMGPQP